MYLGNPSLFFANILNEGKENISLLEISSTEYNDEKIRLTHGQNFDFNKSNRIY